MSDIDKLHRRLVTAHLVGAGLDLSGPSGLAVCPFCERERDDVRRRHKNTAYHDEESNWITCCQDCFDDTREHYQDMWDAYYRDCL